MRFIVTDNKRVGDWAAVYVVNKIKEFNPTPERKFVLGLPTGSTPLQMYKRLIEFNKAGIISFKNVVTFNMDEYLGLEATHDQSYHYYMYNNFFNHIDIEKENINILNGKAENYEEECKRYEEKILELGGIDLLRSANIITSQTYRGVEPLLAVGIIYLILTSIFTAFMRKVERGLKVSD